VDFDVAMALIRAFNREKVEYTTDALPHEEGYVAVH